MIAGAIKVGLNSVGATSLRFGERALTVKGSVFYLPDPVVFTIVYAHIAGLGLVVDETARLFIRFSGTQLDLEFAQTQAAHDAACELLRRMEVVA
jgi:hypothetical protein